MTIADRIRSLVEAMPAESAVTLPMSTLRDWLSDEQPAAAAPAQLQPQSWRERLWTVPPETRLGVKELAEALDRSPDWVYRAVSAKTATDRGRDPLPCQRLDGSLMFTAAAVREWVGRSELVINPARTARRLRIANG